MLPYLLHTHKIICLSIVLPQIFNNLVIAGVENDVNGNNAAADDDDGDPTAIDKSMAGDCTDNYQIRVLKLVLSWGPGICSTKVQCQDPATDFTIHGFWPKFVDTSDSIKCCTREKYDEMVTNPLRRAMHNWWPALNSMDNEDFWSYQWDKHGRCMNRIGKINTVFNYFYFALLNFKEFQIKNALIEDGFEPDDEETYLGSEIVESLQNAYGIKMELDCARLRSDPEIRTLTEVTICFDLDLQPIDCPYSKSRCLKKILFPSSVLDSD